MPRVRMVELGLLSFQGLVKGDGVLDALGGQQLSALVRRW